MIIKEIQSKSIITPSKLPNSDYVINPYVGCSHGCKYCYAEFMKKFTEHEEEWGQFVDVKINGADLIINKNKYAGKSITIGSVTDPYQPVEAKYEITRSILKKLLCLKPNLYIMTKSNLITRDIDLLSQFDHVCVSVSLSLLDDDIRKIIEPGAGRVQDRIQALKILHEAGLKTVLFLAPIMPKLTDWQAIIEKTKAFVDEYWFENLNLHIQGKRNVLKAVSAIDIAFKKYYLSIGQPDNCYWSEVKKKISCYCKQHEIQHKIYFHH